VQYCHRMWRMHSAHALSNTPLVKAELAFEARVSAKGRKSVFQQEPYVCCRLSPVAIGWRIAAWLGASQLWTCCGITSMTWNRPISRDSASKVCFVGLLPSLTCSRSQVPFAALCFVHADAKVLELLQLNPDWYVSISCCIAAISLECLTVL